MYNLYNWQNFNSLSLKILISCTITFAQLYSSGVRTTIRDGNTLLYLELRLAG